jgi:putative transposase
MLYHNKYRIESTRCPKWDYSSPGYYFITIMTHDRGHLFGEIAAGEMHLNEFGKIANEEWRKTGKIRGGIV